MNKAWLNYNQNNKAYARQNRKNPTKCEGLVWHIILKNSKLWVKFMRQKMIGNYITDLYCKELKLVIEIDWSSHDNKFMYDQKRKFYLESLWFIVLNYTDEQITKNLDWVRFDIQKHVFELTPN